MGAGARVEAVCVHDGLTCCCLPASRTLPQDHSFTGTYHYGGQQVRPPFQAKPSHTWRLGVGALYALLFLLNLSLRPQGYNPYEAYGQQPAATSQQPPAQVCPATSAERTRFRSKWQHTCSTVYLR